MNGIIRAASYARVSSSRQAEEMTIESQSADLQTRVTRDQLVIDDVFRYVDDGYSGSELMRPALERLRDHIAASMIDRLYIHSPDRLAREFAHQVILLEEMKRYGCEVIFLNQDGLPDSPETKMLIQMQGMFAEYERQKILERTRRGRRYSASKGNVSVFGRAPYGYRYLKKDGSSRAAIWEIEPLEAEAVRLMFDLVGKSGYSLAAVCRGLKTRNILTQRGQEDWDSTTVLGMLRNPAYYGEARYGKQRLVPRKPGRRAKRGDPEVPRQSKVTVATPVEEQIMIPVPALVNQALFMEVGKQLDENRKRQRARQEGPMYLLSGLVICGECGSAYCSRRQGASDLTYYRCIGTDKYRRASKTICNNASVKGAALEDRVWSDLCCLLRDPGRLQTELTRRENDSSPADEAVEKLASQVKELRGRLDRMIDAYANGLIDKAEFEERIGRLRSLHDREVAALHSKRGELANALDPATASRVFSSLAARVEQNLASASFSLKRELLTLLVKRIEIHHEEIRIVYKVPTNPFVQSPDNSGKLQHRLSLPTVATATHETTDTSSSHDPKGIGRRSLLVW